MAMTELSKTAYEAGTAQLAWRRVVADLETPVGTLLKLAAGRDHAFLLESVTDGATRGRYSMIGVEPDLMFRVVDGLAEINRTPMIDMNAFTPLKAKPLVALRELLAESRLELPGDVPPMSAGIFGYLGYEMVRQMEHLPNPNPDVIGVPEALLMRPSLLAIFDTLKDELYLATPVRPAPGVSAPQAFSAAETRIDDGMARLSRPNPPAPASTEVNAIDIKSNTTRNEYLAMVGRAREYIAAGDIFQVVLSQRFEAKFDLPATAFYRALRRTNPSPYMYYLQYGNFAIAGSSPEILVRVAKGEITVRPIAGTRKRGATPDEDERLGVELLADPKELAEHLMLLDLGRNDVGRVARIGTVKVTDQFFLERYSHVMHIVSNVVGTLDEKYDLIDALAAGFPAGTVSGAPKVRAMEIIDEMEKERRGIYAGCVGYFGADGWMDTCIVLRTAILKDGKVYAQAGAGIVADSDPAAELTECENKARALFSAAEEALRYSGEAGVGQ
jgi:anthranilate synthase component I